MNPKLSQTLAEYISSGQTDLFREGFDLLAHMKDHAHGEFHDYSFLVFPFAKAYEGFLKQVFLDLKFISIDDYQSTHFRIGSVVSPNLVMKLGDRSVYKQICDTVGHNLADEIWHTWRVGRNEVFHYFPHNLKSLTFEEALSIIEAIIKNMEKIIIEYKLVK